MSDKTAATMLQLQDRCGRMFASSATLEYSFEYVYRLVLVFCSTIPSSILTIRQDDPSALDGILFQAMKASIASVCKDRGFNLDERQMNDLTATANEPFVLFLKSSMKSDPAVLARRVAVTMDRKLVEMGFLDEATEFIEVFKEPNL